MTGRLIGYARTHTDLENLQEQIDFLKGAGCIEIYSDEARRNTVGERPGLDQAFGALKPGDFLMVTALDRLSFSHLEFGRISVQLLERGVQISVVGLDDNLAREWSADPDQWPSVQ